MQKTYHRRFAMAYPGKLEGYGTPPQVLSLVNSANSLTDIWEIPAPTAPAVGETYSITVNDVTATVEISENPVTNFVEYSLNGMVPEPITPPGAAAPPTVADTANALLKAIQFSDIFQVAIPRLDSVTNVLRLEACNSGEALTVSAANLTPTNVQVAALSTPIPFGIFVAQRSGDARGTARLPTLATDTFLGITLQTHAIEKMMVSAGNTNQTRQFDTQYWADEAMDVVTKTLTNDGVWVRSLVPEATLSEADTVHVSIDAGTEGWVTNVASATAIAMPYARFRPVTGVGEHLNEPRLSADGEQIALVSINMP
ncbi:MAG: hypothetical protein QNJ46_17665 [Leptolyngbyaceae cyanobacterium MO_188.B28]|nr:hypothetical protein [Leptolyngbyaceae cyanobacterium MO_188.B28]